MLGLRTAASEDTTISPSQAVFGSTVCLPGQLSLESELEQYEFLKQMKATLSGTKIMNSRFNTTAIRIPPAVLPQPLLDTSNVLVHWDGHVPPLALLYNSPSTTVQLAHLHYPDGRPGGGGFHQPPQAMQHAQRGAFNAT